jgi:cell division septum initiation protein DivIVA
MSHLHRQDAQLEEQEDPQDSPRSPFAEVAGRFANWFNGLERMHEHAPADYEIDPDPLRALTAGRADRNQSDGDEAGGGQPESTRFPLAAFGYNRAAVDEHLATLERELTDLRAHNEPPISITEELEKIGEQTASILVVAHDKAHETTRRAQTQAERCIADAAANAVAITEEAKQRLRELDNETDSVWRERERLLEDLRAVSSALNSLADQASDRFPPAGDQASTTAIPAAGPSSRRGGAAAAEMASTATVDPQATQPFDPMSEAEMWGEAPVAEDNPAPARWEDDSIAAGVPDQPEADPADTGSWLAGFEPAEEPDEPQS